MATAPSDNTSSSSTLPRNGRSKAHNRAVICSRRGGEQGAGSLEQGVRLFAPSSPLPAPRSWRPRALRRPARSVNSRVTSPGRRKTSIHCPSTCACRKCEPTAGSTRKASICSQCHWRRPAGRRLPAGLPAKLPTVNCRRSMVRRSGHGLPARSMLVSSTKTAASSAIRVLGDPSPAAVDRSRATASQSPSFMRLS